MSKRKSLAEDLAELFNPAPAVGACETCVPKCLVAVVDCDISCDISQVLSII